MQHFTAVLLTSVALVLVVSSCGGLSPTDVPPPSVLQGTVTLANDWPDSNVNQVLVVALEAKPTSPDSILAAVLSGRAIFSEALPTYTTEAPYEVEIPGAPRTFTYVVVAMQNGPNILTDWLMLDVYSPVNDPAQPGTVIVDVGQTVTINFAVDFNNLPPQPFE
jgi:hypothetical protein